MCVCHFTLVFSDCVALNCTCAPPSSQHSLSQHTHRLVERMGDGDADVRKALVRLLREQCVPNVEGGALRPFMPMIMAHVCRWVVRF